MNISVEVADYLPALKDYVVDLVGREAPLNVFLYNLLTGKAPFDTTQPAKLALFRAFHQVWQGGNAESKTPKRRAELLKKTGKFTANEIDYILGKTSDPVIAAKTVVAEKQIKTEQNFIKPKSNPKENIMDTTPKKTPARRGFAAMNPDKQREIARKGGASVLDENRSFSQDRELAKRAGAKGGSASKGGGRPADRKQVKGAKPQP